jgi:hypothetical protein
MLNSNQRGYIGITLSCPNKMRMSKQLYNYKLQQVYPTRGQNKYLIKRVEVVGINSNYRQIPMLFPSRDPRLNRHEYQWIVEKRELNELSEN